MPGRMYAVVGQFSSAAAIDLVEITTPATGMAIIHKIIVTQTTEAGDAQSEQIDIMIHRGTTGSGGSAATPAPLSLGHAASGVSAEVGNTTQGADGTIVHREAVNVMAGFYYAPTPEERIVVPPSDTLIVSQESTPADSITYDVTLIFEELD